MLQKHVLCVLLKCLPQLPTIQAGEFEAQALAARRYDGDEATSATFQLVKQGLQNIWEFRFLWCCLVCIVDETCVQVLLTHLLRSQCLNLHRSKHCWHIYSWDHRS